jgi:anti-sigma B factor antagonist
MELVIETLPDGIKHAKLVGRLDIPGAMQIDLPFNVLVGNHPKIIIDLSQVSFMASMGIRSLIMGAKTVKSKGGRMVLLHPTPDVAKVLAETGTDTIVPIVQDLEAAIAAVSG